MEDFDFLWKYTSPHWAGRFLDRWRRQVMRSRLEPMKQVARTLRNDRSLILNWFRAGKQISARAVEGLNNKVKVVRHWAYGFCLFHLARTDLYYILGNLPAPEGTHRFC